MKRAILIGGTKGGTGKSTVAVNISVMAALTGLDVILVDADRNSMSSSKFIAHRNDKNISPSPACVQVRGKTLHVEIEKLLNKYELVIIDAGGADSVELRSALSCPVVTEMYSPVQTSDFDLETLSEIDELTCLSMGYNHNLQTYVMLNLCSTHSCNTLVHDAYELIKEFDHIKATSSFLSHRVAFSYSVSHHQSVVEFEYNKIKSMPKWQANKYTAKASQEMFYLYKDIMKKEFNVPLYKELFTKNEIVKNEQ